MIKKPVKNGIPTTITSIPPNMGGMIVIDIPVFLMGYFIINSGIAAKHQINISRCRYIFYYSDTRAATIYLFEVYRDPFSDTMRDIVFYKNSNISILQINLFSPLFSKSNLHNLKNQNIMLKNKIIL